MTSRSCSPRRSAPPSPKPTPAATARWRRARCAHLPIYLPYISPTSPLYLPNPAQPYISPISPLYLPYISPTSPLHLPNPTQVRIGLRALSLPESAVDAALASLHKYDADGDGRLELGEFGLMASHLTKEQAEQAARQAELLVNPNPDPYPNPNPNPNPSPNPSPNPNPNPNPTQAELLVEPKVRQA